MLCEICHKREATVHVTSNVPTEDLVGHPELEALVGERDVCDVCLPLGNMSREELEATARLQLSVAWGACPTNKSLELTRVARARVRIRGAHHSPRAAQLSRSPHGSHEKVHQS